ncbi:MAG: hypothetical protein AB7S54_10750 [Bacteroidales bacterium]
MEELDFEIFQEKAQEQLRAGKPLSGKDGVSAPLLERFLNATLEGGIGLKSDSLPVVKMKQQVQTSLDEVTASTPSPFNPQFIKKRKAILVDSVSGFRQSREISDLL